MENIETNELLDCYKKVLDYIKSLEDKKKNIEKDMKDA